MKKIDLSDFHHDICKWIQDQNKPKTWVAKQIGISVPTLNNWCNRFQIHFEWPIATIKKLVEEDGLKHWEVGRRLGINEKYVSDLCKKHGILSQRRGPRSGEGHPDWKGGIHIGRGGYRFVYSPGHPYAKKPVPYVAEHRLVMEKHLGRYLKRTEVVHHKNGDRSDNRIENLELFERNSLHLKHELTGKCPNWTEQGKVHLQQSRLKYAYNRPGLTPGEREKRQILAHWTAL